MGEVLTLIDRGEHAAGARLFVEQGSRGPGAWAQMPPEERAAMTANAPTFAGEQRDPAWAKADLNGLARLPRPVLLTQGDQSPPFFATIIASLVSAIDHAEVRTLVGAGHVPHATHPSEWVTLVRTFTTAVD